MADLTTIIKGMWLKHPVLPGPGPNVAGAAEAIAAVQGGASALVMQTVTMHPGDRADARRAAYGKDGAFHRQPCTAKPFAQWLTSEFAPALAYGRAMGVPVIPSLGYGPDEVRTMAVQVAAAGADALFYDTQYAERSEILPALRELKAAVPLPVIVRLSPHHGEDLPDLAVQLEPFADAYCLIGSFGPDLLIDVETGAGAIGGVGFLSGAPIRPIAQRFVFETARKVSKPVIAAGGVAAGTDAVEFLMLGAAAVMVSTHALATGPGAYGAIAGELDAWLDAHGHVRIGEISRAYVRKYGHGQRVVTEKEESPQLNAAACIKCTFCETVCFYDAIKAPPKALPTISPDPCFECGLCVSACPTGALYFRRRDEVTLLRAGGRGFDPV